MEYLGVDVGSRRFEVCYLREDDLGVDELEFDDLVDAFRLDD